MEYHFSHVHSRRGWVVFGGINRQGDWDGNRSCRFSKSSSRRSNAEPHRFLSHGTSSPTNKSVGAPPMNITEFIVVTSVNRILVSLPSLALCLLTISTESAMKVLNVCYHRWLGYSWTSYRRIHMSRSRRTQSMAYMEKRKAVKGCAIYLRGA